MISEEEITFYAAMGINPENLHYINEIVPKRVCECIHKKTKQNFTSSRIKEINKKYIANPEDKDIMTKRERDFFTSVGMGCMLPLTSEKQVNYWMEGGRP